MIVERGLKLIAACGQVGQCAGQIGKRFFRRRERRIRLGDAPIDAGEQPGARLRLRLERFFLGGEPVERDGGVGRKLAFTPEVGGELLEPAIEFIDPFLGAGLLALERVARDEKPL